jgi:uncharacterized membrane protein YcaP (DUF421 family)
MHLASTVTDMFALHLPVLEKALRPIIVYLFLLAAFRMTGKRQLAQFTTFDFVLFLMLGNIVQNAIIGDDNSVTGGLIGAGVLLAFDVGVARLLFSLPMFNKIVNGDATTLIDQGQIRQDGLKKLRITKGELTSLIRRQNFTSIREVQLAEVEPTGAIVMEGFHPNAGERHIAEILERLTRIEAALTQPAPASPTGEQRGVPGTSSTS